MNLKIHARFDLTNEHEDYLGIPKVVECNTRQTFGPDIIVHAIAGEPLREALPKALADQELDPSEKALLTGFLKTTGSE